jgi:crotonobetaine/carnitine-CoA ligase
LIILPLIRDVTLALTPRFTASGFWDEVRACGATRIHHLGGILQMLLKQPPSPRDRDHGVTIAWGGGCTAEVWAEFSNRFGTRMVEGYGMTEASSLTTINDEDMPGFVGRALPWFDVRILAPDGRECPRGTRGEIVVAPIGKGAAALFTGYLNSEEATREALRGGRLHTGDQGEMDAEGRVRFHGRLKETIRVRGENVSAWEVEHVVDQHEAVAACAVIPVKADIGEADIKLFIQLAPDRQLSGAELFDWARLRLAPHQLPRHIAFIPAFERTPSERIIKHTLDNAPTGDWSRT